MGRVALITGITGQDGAYLAELLLEKGYEVHGIKRRASLFNTDRVDHLYRDPHERGVRFFMHYGDLTDATNLIRIVQETRPDELYNLRQDPRETRNLVDDQPDEARRLASHFGPYFYRGPLREVKGVQGRYEMGSASVE